MITYYGFLSLFPLLLLMVTTLSYVLQGDPQLRARLVSSTIAELPVIGSQLRDNVHALKGSGVALAVGILGTLYGCLGLAGATQNAFNRAWAVPRNERPNPIALRGRSLLLLLVLGAGVIMTTGLSWLATGAGALGATFATWLGVAAVPIATVVNVGRFMVAFRVLTASEVPWRRLRVGAVVAGIGLADRSGARHVSRHAAEGSARDLRCLRPSSSARSRGSTCSRWSWWSRPRSTSSPSGAVAPDSAHAVHRPRAATPADKRAYAAYAQSERHKGFEVVDVGLDTPAETGAKDGTDQER